MKHPLICTVLYLLYTGLLLPAVEQKELMLIKGIEVANVNYIAWR